MAEHEHIGESERSE